MSPATRDRAVPLPVRLCAVPVLLLLLSVSPLTAQRSDFLFGRPVLTVAVSTGWAVPGEGSDLFSFSRDHLTVSRGDFASLPFQAEAAIRVTERFDVTAGFEYAGATVTSEMRDWVTQDDQPIPQTTAFKRYRLMGGVKAYLFRRGRSISEYAWVPSPWSPYVGAGVGTTWYEFTQQGDFVDFETQNIFSDRFTSKGSGFTPYVAGGVDISLAAHFLLRTEVRYLWGSAPVDPAVFQGFEDIDLSGFRGTIGFAFRTGGRL